MSYNKNYFSNGRIFWKNLKIKKCPILGCDGNMVETEEGYECDICVNFKISKKKFWKLSK